MTAVGGPTQGADPIAVATALVATGRGRPLKAFSVRARAKDHGSGGRLVGPVGPHDRVAVVEDTTTTGGSLLEVADVLAAEGIPVVQAIVLVDRSDGAVAAAARNARGWPYGWPDCLSFPFAFTYPFTIRRPAVYGNVNRFAVNVYVSRPTPGLCLSGAGRDGQDGPQV